MVAKGWVGLATGSLALFADAVHSAADVVGSAAVLVGLRVARKPPDSDHPYGHGKAELLSSAIVAVLLLGAGVEIGVTSLRALFEPAHAPGYLAAETALVAIGVKESLYHYTFRLGTRIGSRSLIATAYDHRSDVFSSVAALCGVVLADVGHLLAIAWLKHMDAAAGVLVALLILGIGYQLARDSAQTLMDKVAPITDLSGYETSIYSVAGVRRIDDLRVRDHGQYVIVDVAISVDADISVAAGHDIASAVRSHLMQSNPRVMDALVHVNPFRPLSPRGQDNERS